MREAVSYEFCILPSTAAAGIPAGEGGGDWSERRCFQSPAYNSFSHHVEPILQAEYSRNIKEASKSLTTCEVGSEKLKIFQETL